MFRFLGTIIFLALILVSFSCKRQYACWCEATVTVDTVTTVHKYKENVLSRSRKDGKKQCQKYAQDTQYSQIDCALYDY